MGSVVRVGRQPSPTAASRENAATSFCSLVLASLPVGSPPGKKTARRFPVSFPVVGPTSGIPRARLSSWASFPRLRGWTSDSPALGKTTDRRLDCLPGPENLFSVWGVASLGSRWRAPPSDSCWPAAALPLFFSLSVYVYIHICIRIPPVRPSFLVSFHFPSLLYLCFLSSCFTGDHTDGHPKAQLGDQQTVSQTSTQPITKRKSTDHADNHPTDHQTGTNRSPKRPPDGHPKDHPTYHQTVPRDLTQQMTTRPFKRPPRRPLNGRPKDHPTDQSKDHPKYHTKDHRTHHRHSGHKFDPNRDLILIKSMTQSSIQDEVTFDQNSDPKFNPKWDLIWIKILTPSLIPNGISS